MDRSSGLADWEALPLGYDLGWKIESNPLGVVIRGQKATSRFNFTRIQNGEQWSLLLRG